MRNGNHDHIHHVWVHSHPPPRMNHPIDWPNPRDAGRCERENQQGIFPRHPLDHCEQNIWKCLDTPRTLHSASDHPTETRRSKPIVPHSRRQANGLRTGRSVGFRRRRAAADGRHHPSARSRTHGTRRKTGHYPKPLGTQSSTLSSKQTAGAAQGQGKGATDRATTMTARGFVHPASEHPWGKTVPLQGLAPSLCQTRPGNDLRRRCAPRKQDVVFPT